MASSSGIWLLLARQENAQGGLMSDEEIHEFGVNPHFSRAIRVRRCDDRGKEPNNDTWKWIEKDLTLVTVPEADHWVQQDASDLVTRTMVSWLNR